MKPDLPVCALCGGEGQLKCHDISREPGREGYSVDCEDCANCTAIFPTEQKAEEAWTKENPVKLE